MLKYYIKSNQEIIVLGKQLSKQGMIRQGDVLVYDESRALGSVYLAISPVDRIFSFNRLDKGSLRTYMQYTLCDSLTEVLKRTWNTYIDKGKWGAIYSEHGSDVYAKAILDNRRILLGKF